ncbi:S1 family peptidase [Nocardia sp. NBC_01499]|uniref:hypothetical protein n=1 Tax=Nocardia sp. NBC_01499 TaxID=2903597 RepID=UPI00386ED2B4
MGLTGTIRTLTYAVTAGHCWVPGKNVDTVTHDANGEINGTFVAGAPDSENVVGAAMGYGLLEINPFQVAVSGSFDRYSLESIDTNPQVGQQVCKLGARTGLSCGTISRIGDNYFLIDGMHSDHGDSGGIVFRELPNGHAVFVGTVNGFLETQRETVIAQSASNLLGQLDAFAAGKGDTFHFQAGS